MYEVLPKLREGIGGVSVPDLAPEREAEWSEGYAIIENLYPDESVTTHNYFDRRAWKIDYQEMVKDLFPGCVVIFYWSSQEIEVMHEEDSDG